jgi:predicted acylesterase/phospholipase RssA
MSYIILSFDGGGIRGVLSARLLARLGPAAIEKADCFAGTSTGSFIALGLAAGLTPEDLVALYERAGPSIFTPAKGRLETLLGVKAQYTRSGLKKELTQAFARTGLNPEGPLSQLKKEVVIVAFRLKDPALGHWEPVIFTRQSKVSLIDAALMSSAAPTYFPSYKGYVDGGVCANNPSVVAIGIAAQWGISLNDMRMLSVGTGRVSHRIDGKESWGALKWLVNLFGKKAASSHPLLSLFYDAEEALATLNSQHMLKGGFYRLNPTLKVPIGLDDTKAIKELVGVANCTDLSGAQEWIEQIL